MKYMFVLATFLASHASQAAGVQLESCDRTLAAKVLATNKYVGFEDDGGIDTGDKLYNHALRDLTLAIKNNKCRQAQVERKLVFLFPSRKVSCSENIAAIALDSRGKIVDVFCGINIVRDAAGLGF